VVCRALSGLDGLAVEDMPVPEPGPGEVRVRVRAAGLNFADTLIIRGQYQEKPDLPFVPGMEIAGQIEACGAGVLGFRVGERVLATLAHGGFAEHAVMPASDVARLPDAVDYVTAAGFAVAYGTAYGALLWSGRLRAGQTLVVHGAGGGVGLAAVECGKALGARVIASARGSAHLAAARQHGADAVIDTARDDVRARLKELCGAHGADVVFDPIGGELFQASLRSIAWEGRLLIIGFASGEIPQIPANRLLLKNAAAIGFYWGSYRRHDPARVHAAFEELLRWHGEERIHPHVSKVLPLERAKEALELLLSRKSTGKLVLSLDG
ncbi:MAG: NADPH:quinone oxidoreductase family protein, partial [Geminicoccaceae bacterium]